MDVYAPAGAHHRPPPAIIFYYGGGALTGAAAWYSGLARLARDGAVVFVAQYRLGPLGWLAHRSLSATAESGSSGNYGLMDALLGARFARANAAAFGAQPDRLTAMGQSSGATVVWGLAAHPGAAGVLDAAIVLSGSPNVSMPLAAAEAQNERFPEHLGCPPGSAAAVVRCLRSKSAEAVSHGHPPINSTWQENDHFTWGLPAPATAHGYSLPGIVIVDGVFLRGALLPQLSGPRGIPDLLVSNVAEECDLCPEMDFSGDDWGPLRRYLSSTLAPWGGRALAARLLDIYNATAGTPQQAYVQICANLGTTCGQLAIARSAAAAHPEARIHFAIMSEGPAHPQTLGVRRPAGCGPARRLTRSCPAGGQPAELQLALCVPRG